MGNNTNKSCWGSNESSIGKIEIIEKCPKCGEIGNEVKISAVRHLVDEKHLSKLVDEKYFVCMDEACEVVYYNSNGASYFTKDDVSVPIWFKKDADPKYICYCNKVTEEDIIKAVLNDGAENMKDIVRLTGAMKNPKCELNNPLGKCCGENIQAIIDKTLKTR